MLQFGFSQILLLGFLALLVSCGDPFGGKSGPLTVRSLGAARSTFAEVDQLVLGPHCLRCHGQYQNEDAVLLALPRIIQRVESGSMPPGGPKLPENLIAVLRNFQAPTTQPDRPLEATWPSISSKLLGPKCMGCHNPNGQALFLDLSSRQAIFEARDRLSVDDQKLINFDSPDESSILTRVRDAVEPMPPLPPFSDLEQLTEDEIAVFRDWIAKGLP